MDAGDDSFIAVGRPHRTTSEVEVLIYDFDSLSGKRAILPARSIFKPWKPQEHWRYEEVPITLGGAAVHFDWGLSSADGHFLRWDDFFTKCELAEALTPDEAAAMPVLRRAPSAEGHVWDSSMMAKLADVTQHIASVHHLAAEMQRGAEGFDETQSVRIYGAVRKHLLAASQDIEKAREELVVKLRY